MTVKHRLFQDMMLSGCGLYSVHMLTVLEIGLIFTELYALNAVSELLNSASK